MKKEYTNREAKKLLKKNNESEKQILKENDDIYTDMIVYLRSADISEYYQEKVREDLIEMIVHGQERGDDIKKVMGENYKQICDDIIAEMPKKTKAQKITDAVIMSLDIIWILGFIYVAKAVFSMLLSRKFVWHVDVKIGEIVSALAIAFVANIIVIYICKTALNDRECEEEDKKNNKLTTFLKTWILLLFVSAAIILPAIFLQQTLFVANIIVMVIVFAVVFVTSKLLWWFN